MVSRSKTKGEDGEEVSQSRGAPVVLLLMLLCCGLPFLVIAAGSLTSLSAITGSVAQIFAGAAAAALLGIGIVVRRRNKSRRKNQVEMSAAINQAILDETRVSIEAHSGDPSSKAHYDASPKKGADRC